MSVFKLQEWWNVRVGADEEFDSGSMVVGNLDNSSVPADKIAVGSFQGMLRVYAPVKPTFRVEDLLIESNLGEPILQMLSGMFLPSSTNVALAVLHPRKVVVYELEKSGADKGGYHTLRKAYAHDLGIDGQHFTAFNMVSGAFGGVNGRDLLAVQSMDGKLQIFEQTANAFMRQFVDCLYPGPLLYLPRLDAFLTVNTSCEAQCFRYQVLANSQGDIGAASKTGAFAVTAMRSTLMEWSVIMGETCLQIIEGSFSGSTQDSKKKGAGSSSSELLLVCEHSIFLVKESGGVLQQRRIERSPSCICAYKSGQSGIDNFLLASHDGTIQVYSRFNLVWAAKFDKTPVSMCVAEFGQQPGLLVTLDDTGSLSISFMGTKPPLSVASSTVSRDLDYGKVDEEHKALLQIIRQHQTSSKLEPKEKLILRSQVPRQLDTASSGPDVQLPSDLMMLPESFSSGAGGLVKICIRLYVAFSGKGMANNVSIIVSAPSFVHVVPKNTILKSVSANSTPVMIKLYMYAYQSQIASSLKCDVTATYKASSGEPRIANHIIQLPLFLACTLRPASKSAAYKFTLDSGKPPVPLTELFDDLIFALKETGQNVSDVVGNTETQALGFQMWASPQELSNAPPANVSILVSKSGGRYRVQSDCLQAIYLISSELERRLNAQMMRGVVNPPPEKIGLLVSNVRCEDRLQLDLFFEEIAAHFDIRKNLQSYFSQLNDSSHLFRVIQKRLLTRFKDRNASALGGLDVIMRETYDQIIRLADLTQEAQRQLHIREVNMGCITKLLVQLTGMRLGMTASDRALLETYFCPDLPHGSGGCSDGLDGTGWEEMVELSLTFLLKTALSKNPKATTKVNTSAVEMPENIDTLKQRISLVFVKLDEGKKMTLPPEERMGEDDNASRK